MPNFPLLEHARLGLLGVGAAVPVIATPWGQCSTLLLGCKSLCVCPPPTLPMSPLALCFLWCLVGPHNMSPNGRKRDFREFFLHVDVKTSSLSNDYTFHLLVCLLVDFIKHDTLYTVFASSCNTSDSDVVLPCIYFPDSQCLVSCVFAARACPCVAIPCLLEVFVC